MVGDVKINNKEGSVSNGNLLVALDSKEIRTNGFPIAAENGTIGDVNSAGSSGDAMRTYKRRKHPKITENGKLDKASTSQVNDQPAKEPYYKTLSTSCNMLAHLTPMDLHACANGANGCSPEHWRNFVLEHMSQMLECEGGLRGCIRDSISHHLKSCRTTAVKGFVQSCEYESKSSSQTGLFRNKLHNEVGGNEGMVPNGPRQKSDQYTGKELCQRTFYDVISSEKFAKLCHLLLKGFPGIMAGRFLDITSIDSRMKEGSYENSPDLFHTDVQQVWTKIENIGWDMVALAKSLSDISKTSFREQAGSLSRCSTEVRKQDETDMHDKGDWLQACTYKVSACKNCGENADVRSCLVCDSCEEIYHVACIEPAIEDIPRSWYCASCTANGIGSPHDGCVVCERMNSFVPLSRDGACQKLENHEGLVMESKESTNDFLVDELKSNGGEDSPTCIICRSVVKIGENLKICPHDFCPHKLYHVACLTSNELKTYGPQWYCPSCLCRSCLADKDDDKIVLCDGCDHAYHVYCMQPPRTSVPEGKWFCKKCDADVRSICQAKRSYENMHHKLQKTAEGGDGFVNGERTEEIVADATDNKPGGMDMLLNAVRSLDSKDDITTLGLS